MEWGEWLGWGIGIGTGKSQEQQEEIWIANEELARSPGHPFYQRLNELLEEEKFDRFVEGLCRKFHGEKMRCRGWCGECTFVRC